MVDYKAIIKYCVFIMDIRSDMGDSYYTLVRAEHNGFDDESLAEDWIQAHGERKNTYVILKEYRKP